MSFVGPFGNTSGTKTSAGGPASHKHAVTSMTVYSDSNYIYGMTLNWSGQTPNTYTYGNTGGGTSHNVTFSPLCCRVDYTIDTSMNTYYRGSEWYNFVLGSDNLVASLGGYTAGNESTAFDEEHLRWSDVDVYVSSVGGTNTIVGITFYYYDTRSSSPVLYRQPVADMALPALGIMANAMVVAKSVTKLGRLNRELNVKPSSCEPPQGTDPLKVQLWHRTFRAQENCHKFFVLYAPTIMIAAIFGQEVFGKWAPRVVGALSLAGAFFRYKYMNAYIKDAESRGSYFSYSKMTMKPVFYLAVVSCGYLVGKQLHCHLNKKNIKWYTEEGNEQINEQINE